MRDEDLETKTPDEWLEIFVARMTIDQSDADEMRRAWADYEGQNVDDNELRIYQYTGIAEILAYAHLAAGNFTFEHTVQDSDTEHV